MNSVHVADWEAHANLVRAIQKPFKRWSVTFDFGIWCPVSWAELKKETLCADALMHVTLESQALQAWEGFVNFRRDLDAVAEKRNCYWERGFNWSIHLYEKKPS